MSQDSSERPPRSAARIGCLLIVGSLLLLLLIVGAGVIGCNMRTTRQVREELARLRTEGEPTNAAELADFYDSPPAPQDVTQLLLNAVAPLEGRPFIEDAKDLPEVGTAESVPPLGKPWPELPAVEEFLAKYRPSLEMLHNAAQRGGAARYPVDFEAGLTATLQHVQSLRDAARMLTLEAHVRARRDDAKGALESIETILSLAKSLEREPVIVSQLVRVAIDGIAFGLLEPLLPSGRFTDADLARLQGRFQSIKYDEGVHRAMMGERVFDIIALQTMNLDGNQTNSDRLTSFPFQNEILRVYLEWMRRAVDATRHPLPQRLDEVSAINAELHDEALKAGPLGRYRFLAAELLIPATSATFSAGARGNAQMQLACTGIAVERFRRKHGKFPDRLEQLVPEFLAAIPGDPFDGRPLRYVVRDGRAIVYSVGQDHVDDGGQGDPNLEKSDIVFTLTTPNRPSSPPKR